MKIVITGSLDNISNPLLVRLIEKGQEVTVISSSATKKGIEALGAKATIGKPKLDFITNAFTGAEMVYLMEPTEPDRFRDKTYDPHESVRDLITVYQQAVEKMGSKKNCAFKQYRRVHVVRNGLVAVPLYGFKVSCGNWLLMSL